MDGGGGGVRVWSRGWPTLKTSVPLSDKPLLTVWLSFKRALASEQVTARTTYDRPQIHWPGENRNTWLMAEKWSVYIMVCARSRHYKSTAAAGTEEEKSSLWVEEKADSRSKDQMEFLVILFRLWDSSHICDSFGLHLRPVLIVLKTEGSCSGETYALSTTCLLFLILLTGIIGLLLLLLLSVKEESWPCCKEAFVICWLFSVCVVHQKRWRMKLLANCYHRNYQMVTAKFHSSAATRKGPSFGIPAFTFNHNYRHDTCSIQCTLPLWSSRLLGLDIPGIICMRD